MTGFTQRWRCADGHAFGWFAAANLWPYRARQPSDMHAWHAAGGATPEIVTEANRHMVALIRAAKRIVLAWGVNGAPYPDRVQDVKNHLRITMRPDQEVGHIGLTKDGHPGHPLMVGYAQPFIRIIL